MSTIKAVELLTSLVTAVEPPKDVVILLRRRDPSEGVARRTGTLQRALPSRSRRCLYLTPRLDD